MKYYETTFEEYIQSSKQNDLHPELNSLIHTLPKTVDKFQNLILYGPSGSGKYTQALKIIEQYSPTRLHYDRKISVSNEKTEKKKQIVVEATNNKKKSTTQAKKEINVSKKQEFTYRISDIHYEVDMSLLGCNSKNLWHDIYFQIVDIVSVKSHKTGIIVCKNFDCIYNELLDIFYSYIKHPLDHVNTHIYFIILTENISFIPTNILHSSFVIPIKRPQKEVYHNMINTQSKSFFFQTIEKGKDETVKSVLDQIDNSSILNSKELYMLKKIDSIEELPCDIDFTICDKILEQMNNPDEIKLIEFRNLIYDLLVYNVNIPECIYYIITESLQSGSLNESSISEILQYSYTFFKYYNNNYRSIYHLESMIFFIMNKTHFKINSV
jgi:Cdc6-like AAA superfamily ATPase